MANRGILVVVSGFSGAGKGTLMKHLLEKYDNYALSISATTRAPREGEEHGREYFFHTKQEFEELILHDALIEYAQYVENYYGTPKAYVEKQLEAGKDVILEIEIQGALKVKEKFPDTLLLFVTPPSAEELKRRLINRGTETKEFKVKREKIKVNPVEAKVLQNNIGYIKFSSFDEDTAEDFKKKYEELNKQGIKSLIIDLRNNGGGIVTEALEIADYFTPKDSILLYEVDKNNKEEIEKSKNEAIINMPVIILTNENTASSSEILAGALKDLEKAKIVGTKTYGKGVIQEVLSLPDGSGIKITSEEYLTPNKTKINKVGIQPDVEIKLPETVKNILDVEEKDDTQLQKAIEMLKK